MRTIVSALVAVLLACGLAAAQTYYVATTGNDMNAGTEAAPFKTVDQSVAALRPGDTVLIRAGRYPACTVRDLKGTAEAWITFKAYPGEKPVFDRALAEPGHAWTIHILGHCAYLVFEGLEVTDTDPLIDTLRKLDLHKPADLEEFKKHLDEVQYRDGVRINPPGSGERHHDLIFRNLEVHHCIGLGFSGRGDNFQFIGNHVYDLGNPRSGYGWYTSGANHVYRGNRVHDCSYGFHLYGNPVTNAIIEDNVIWNTGGTFWHMSSKQVKDGGNALLVWAEGGNCIIRNNVLYGNQGGITVDSPGTLVLNNTVYATIKTGLHVFADKGVTVRNNIVYKSGVKDLDVGAGNTADHNLVGIDPLFVDPANGNFHLRAGSPAIGAGVARAGIDTDAAGVARPQGKAIDLGAYQFVPGEKAK